MKSQKEEIIRLGKAKTLRITGNLYSIEFDVKEIRYKKMDNGLWVLHIPKGLSYFFPYSNINHWIVSYEVKAE